MPGTFGAREPRNRRPCLHRYAAARDAAVTGRTRAVTYSVHATLPYASVPVVFAVVGAVVGTLPPWAARLRSYGLHIAADVVFAVDPLPEVQRRASAVTWPGSLSTTGTSCGQPLAAWSFRRGRRVRYPRA